MGLFEIPLKGNRIFFLCQNSYLLFKIIIITIIFGMDVCPQMLQGKETETERQNVSKSSSQAHSSAQHFFPSS